MTAVRVSPDPESSLLRHLDGYEFRWYRRRPHHLLTTLSSDLVGNFDVDISFVWDRTQDPPPLADGTLPERDDYRLLVGLSYEF